MNEYQMLFSIAGGMFFLAVVILIVSVRKKRTSSENRKDSPSADQVGVTRKFPEEEESVTKEFPPELMAESAARNLSGTAGVIHHIGKRNSQQDSYGFAQYDKGIFAVVADGMGGLSEGDKVSRKIVDTMLEDADYLTGKNTDGMLYWMLAHANQEVNHMLEEAGQLRSGSTLIAILLEKNTLQWVSLGDSRLCLFRGGQLIQLNREHVYEAELLCRAVNCEISFDEVKNDPERRSLSSFVGMGRLRYIDGSMRPLLLRQGDRILLMTDGVYNTLSEQEIAGILIQNADAAQAAAVLEKSVLDRQNPRQDNFTALILDA